MEVKKLFYTSVLCTIIYLFKRMCIKVFPMGLYCSVKDVHVFSWSCSVNWMSLCDATVLFGVSGCCFTPLKAFLIVSLAVEVKETQVLMVGPTVCCVLWATVNSIWSVPRFSSLLWMLPYNLLTTFLTIVRQEEVKLHAAACYCVFFHWNIFFKIPVLLCWFGVIFLRSLAPVDICVCPLNLADISCLKLLPMSQLVERDVLP